MTAKMDEVLLKVANGLGDGTAHHNFLYGNPDDDPYLFTDWREACLEYNGRLRAWQRLRRKATTSGATVEIKKEYVKKTMELYSETFNRLSIKMITFDGHDQEKTNKLEKDVKNIKADMRKLLIALNMEPSGEDEEGGASGMPPAAKPPLPNSKEKGRFQQEPVA